jgi:hypothetical protein
MAHFAELESKTDPTGFTSDTHLVVKRVIVVGNDIEANGGTLADNDMHVDGETWCVNFLVVELGNKHHIIIILESNMQV